MKFLFYIIIISLCHAAEIMPEIQEKLGIKTISPVTQQLPPQVATYGAVISPAPLIDLYRQIEAAQAAADVSQESLTRAEKLFAEGELVARRDVQAARALLTQDAAKIRALEDRVILEWGLYFSKLDPAGRTSLITKILQCETILIRLTLPQGSSLDASPIAAKLYQFGKEKTIYNLTSIFPSPTADPTFQSPTFFSIFESNDSTLVPGITLTGVLELSGQPRAGLLIPQDAVISYLGKDWIYLNAEKDHFERIEISTTEPTDGGWFITEGKLEAGKIVIVGAQALLSAETLAPEAE